MYEIKLASRQRRIFHARRREFTDQRRDSGSIPGGFAPGFSHVGIVLDDAAGRRVFSGISRFPRRSVPALLHTHLNHPHRLSRPRTDSASRLTRETVNNSTSLLWPEFLAFPYLRVAERLLYSHHTTFSIPAAANFESLLTASPLLPRHTKGVNLVERARSDKVVYSPGSNADLRLRLFKQKTRVIEVSMERRRNEGARTRKQNRMFRWTKKKQTKTEVLPFKRDGAEKRPLLTLPAYGNLKGDASFCRNHCGQEPVTSKSGIKEFINIVGETAFRMYGPHDTVFAQTAPNHDVVCASFLLDKPISLATEIQELRDCLLPDGAVIESYRGETRASSSFTGQFLRETSSYKLVRRVDYFRIQLHLRQDSFLHRSLKSLVVLLAVILSRYMWFNNFFSSNLTTGVCADDSRSKSRRLNSAAMSLCNTHVVRVQPKRETRKTVENRVTKVDSGASAAGRRKFDAQLWESKCQQCWSALEWCL
ncbi:hypothetical protein PR048_000433 [Dryococelus australis]|uniref:Uncharacterized protein n=1 Tax=Dryococelus australis TaxID=614101 RepID=A0ABQ9IEL3_9NEOP|nr:hypothetical protein PR048_000433 [Dryococelus australis]